MLKHIFAISLLCFFLSSCNMGSENIPEAISTARKAMQLTIAGNYQDLQSMYEEGFAESEPPEVRIEKFKQIFAATGKVNATQLMDSAKVQANEEGIISVQFMLTTARTKVIQTIELQHLGGSYKISRMDITQYKQ
jgi:hypothetical protein